MAGENPYIKRPETRRPEKAFTVTFVGADVDGGEKVVEVDPRRWPDSHEGLPGSILQIALEAGIDIDHACGGVCACSTCHVIVEEGGETCPEATEDEEDMLDLAPDLTPSSRLGCQAVPDGTRNLVVRLPNWNRNRVREAH